MAGSGPAHRHEQCAGGDSHHPRKNHQEGIAFPLENGEFEIHPENAGERTDQPDANSDYSQPLQQPVSILRHARRVKIIARQDGVARPVYRIDQSVVSFGEMSQVMAVFLTHGRTEVRPVKRRNGAAVLRDQPAQTCRSAPEHGQRVERIVPLA